MTQLARLEEALKYLEHGRKIHTKFSRDFWKRNFNSKPDWAFVRIFQPHILTKAQVLSWHFCSVFHGYRAFTIGLRLESGARVSGPGSGLEIQIPGLGLGLRNPDFRARARAWLFGLGLRNLDSRARARARVFRTQSFYFLFFWNKSLDVPGCISCWKKIFLETLVLIRLRSSLEKYTKKLSDNFLLPHW